MNNQEKLTEAEVSGIIKQLEDYLKEHESNPKISQNSIAKEIGCSGSLITQIKTGSYPSDPTSYLLKLRKYFERELQLQTQPAEKIKFVRTSNAKIIWGMAEFSRTEKEFCIVTGPPGCGKTIALKEYLDQNISTTLIEATLSIEAKTLFEMLHKELRLSGAGRIHNMLMEVVEHLKSTNHLIIIDEAEYLPYKALEHARRLADFAGIGLMLSGTSRLIRNLKGRRGEHAQLWSRVANKEELGPLTHIEAKLIIQENLPGVNGLWEVLYSYSKKNARVLGHLIKLTKYLARKHNAKIDEDLINSAANQLITNS